MIDKANPMKLQIENNYPESGTRCSEINLNVRIIFDEPFVAPGEWDHDELLRQLVGDDPLDRHHIEHYDIYCTSHIKWADLKPIDYIIGAAGYQTTTEDERRYRFHCRESGLTPTQQGFWMFVLKNNHGIRATWP